jgi:hypothetical protein
MFKALLFFLLLFCSSGNLLSQQISKLIPYVNHKTKKWGYKDTTGRIAVDTIYTHASPFMNGFAFVMRNTGMAIIDSQGKLVTGFIFRPDRTPYYCSDSIVAVKTLESKYFGLIKTNGQILTEFKYLGVGHFWNGYCQVHLAKGHGFVNSDGVEVIPPKYDLVEDFEEGVCHVQQNEKYFFIDSNDKKVVPGNYDYIRQSDFFCNGYCRVNESERTYFIDKKGNEVKVNKEEYERCLRNREAEKTRIFYGYDVDAPMPRFDSINSFGGMLPYSGFVYKDYYNKDGGVVFSNSFGRLSEFHEGIAIMSADSTISGIDSKGRNKGLFPGVYNKVGVIDVKGRVIVDFKYGRIDHFKNGIALVWKSVGNSRFEMLGYIDRKGREYWTPASDK